MTCVTPTPVMRPETPHGRRKVKEINETTMKVLNSTVASLLACFDMGDRAGVELAALVRGQLETVALANSGAEIGAGSEIRGGG